MLEAGERLHIYLYYFLSLYILLGSNLYNLDFDILFHNVLHTFIESCFLSLCLFVLIHIILFVLF